MVQWVLNIVSLNVFHDFMTVELWSCLFCFTAYISIFIYIQYQLFRGLSNYIMFFCCCVPHFLASHMVSLQELKKLPGPGVRGTELGNKKFRFQKAKNQTCTYWIWNLLLKFQFAQFLIPYLYYIYSFFISSLFSGGHKLLGLQVAMVSQSGKMVRYMASLMSGWLTW